MRRFHSSSLSTPKLLLALAVLFYFSAISPATVTSAEAGPSTALHSKARAASVSGPTAGPNAGGTLLIHADSDPICATCSGCLRTDPLDCETAETSAGKFEIVLLTVFAAFPSDAEPEIGSVSFGIEYGRFFWLLDLEPCSGSETTTANWPNSGEGTTLVFNPPKTKQNEPIYKVTTYLYYADEPFELVPHPEVGGVFGNADGTTFDPIIDYGRFGFVGRAPCPDEVPTGACCDGQGQCHVTWQRECEHFGGAYLGDDTTCGPSDCLIVAACCDAVGMCQLLSATDCAASGGIFESALDICEPNPCPNLMGACCEEDGRRCAVTAQEDCSADDLFIAGGLCNPSACVGSCCLVTGECIEIEPFRCSGEGDVIGTTCDPDPCLLEIGACCVANGSCQILTPEQCAEEDGLFLAETECSFVLCWGACCLPDETCERVRPNDCEADVGVFRGMATACQAACPDELGACCLEDRVCVILPESECDAQGGTYLGGDEPCEAELCYGACCTENGVCAVIRRDLCENNGGTFFGSGSACEEVDCDPAAAESESMPSTLTLRAPRPNPASDRFVISFGLPEETNVRVALHSVTGGEVERLADGLHEAGWHRVEVQAAASELPSGIYFIRVTAGEVTRTERLVLSR